jgi:hypothetical protein
MFLSLAAMAVAGAAGAEAEESLVSSAVFLNANCPAEGGAGGQNKSRGLVIVVAGSIESDACSSA